MQIYRSTITGGALRLRESRVVAGLLLESVSDERWQEEIFERNALQIRSVESRKKISRMIRTRLEPMGEGLWKMVSEGDKIAALQATLAGAVKESRLLGDFMDITLREQKSLFADRLRLSVWNEFIEGCHGRDPEMPPWSDQTLVRLRSSVLSILSEAGYLENTRSLRLQNVFVDGALSNHLEERGESYVLRCLRVAEG